MTPRITNPHWGCLGPEVRRKDALAELRKEDNYKVANVSSRQEPFKESVVESIIEKAITTHRKSNRHQTALDGVSTDLFFQLLPVAIVVFS